VRHVIGEKWTIENVGYIKGDLVWCSGPNQYNRKFGIIGPGAMQHTQTEKWLEALTNYITAVDPDLVNRMVNEISLLKRQVVVANREAEHWKANHTCEVDRARVLKERPDMPLERVNAYNHMTALEEENKSLKAQIASLQDREQERAMVSMIHSTSIESHRVMYEVRDILKSHFRTGY
jgi:hypothetical protein